MNALVKSALKWAQETVIEWLEGPEGRAVLIKVLRDLAARTDTQIDDTAVEIVVQGLENVEL